VERTKALLGLHAPFDSAMILLQDVVQVLDRSVAAAAAQSSVFLSLRQSPHRRDGPYRC
jgi:predicted hotdog family 3-hydroxylacyl-ACP dehydratase